MAETLAPNSPTQLQNAATTGNGGYLLLYGQGANITIALQSTGTTSGGVVTIEEAFFNPSPTNGLAGPMDYTGTWSAIGSTIAASTFSGGAQVLVHVGTISGWAIRARISSTITGGGTVSAWAWAS